MAHFCFTSSCSSGDSIALATGAGGKVVAELALCIAWDLYTTATRCELLGNRLEMPPHEARLHVKLWSFAPCADSPDLLTTWDQHVLEGSRKLEHRMSCYR